MANFSLLHQSTLVEVTITTQFGVSVSYIVPLKIAQLILLSLRSSTTQTAALIAGNIILSLAVIKINIEDYLTSWFDDIAYMWLAFGAIRISNLAQIVFGGAA